MATLDKPLYWINSKNFGDALNPLIYEKIKGEEPIRHYFTNGDKEFIMAIGSIIHLAKPGTLIWGTGAMAEDMIPRDADETTQALAVRGPLTAWMLRNQGVDISNTVLADPAILVPFLFDVEFERVKSQIIPHYVDYEFASKLPWREEWELTSPTSDIHRLIQVISQSDTIITSSLHVLIVAEAFGVPTVWAEFSDNVTGDGFKFWDYYLSTHRKPPEPIQIRDNAIPWGDINHRLWNWDLDMDKMRKLAYDLMAVCPFKKPKPL